MLRKIPLCQKDVKISCFRFFYCDSYHESNWLKFRSRVLEISNSLTLVWLPPSSYDNYAGMGYTPVAYFHQSNKFGFVSDLKQLIKEFKDYGVKCIADIVINHRADDGSWGNFPVEYFNGESFRWDGITICCTDEIKDQHGQVKPTGAHDTGDDFEGARNIDHTNPLVQKTIKHT